MTALDWGIAIVLVALLPLGARLGLLAGLGALLGFAGGAALGARIASGVLPAGASAGDELTFALLCAALLATLLGTLGLAPGRALRRRLEGRRAAVALDALGGIACLAALILGAAWLLAGLAERSPALHDARDELRASSILDSVTEALPEGGALRELRRRAAAAPPTRARGVRVRGPQPAVRAPERGILGAPRVRAAQASVVRVAGVACGLAISGTGWAAAPEIVVTNAHVIAGEEETTVVDAGGTEREAIPALVRPRDDIAVLRVPGLAAPALPLARRPAPGTPGAVLGHAGGGALKPVPARLGQTGLVRSNDAYGRGPKRRLITPFRGRVERGDSGAPVVGRRGRVLTTVFAATVGSKPRSGLGVPNERLRAALAAAPEGGRAASGPCP